MIEKAAITCQSLLERDARPSENPQIHARNMLQTSASNINALPHLPPQLDMGKIRNFKSQISSNELRRRITKEPEAIDFPSSELFRMAWESWRLARDKNNTAVVKSRKNARTKKKAKYRSKLI